ncbi:MAG: hypothetical protein ABIS36_18550 [Chryseolinea sp.]
MSRSTHFVGGTTKNLVHHKTIWFDPSGVYQPGSAPLITLCIVLAIAVLITLYDLKRATISHWFDAILLVITGLIGFLLCFYGLVPITKPPPEI